MNKNMLVRATSGIVYVGVILGCIYVGAEAIYALFVVLMVLCMLELQRLLSQKAYMSIPVRCLDIFVALSVIVGLYFWGKDTDYLLLPALLYLPVRMIFAVLDKSESPAQSMAYSLFSIVYILVPFLFLATAGILNTTAILATFIFIWINDTGAYLTGMNFGRTKLCERLSPKKTWEGFWGGFVLTIIAGVVFGLCIGYQGSQLVSCSVFAALISVFGTFGDLFESMIKRFVGVKDSGNLIPGHGGILDRVDSLLAVAPIVIFMAILFYGK